MAGKANPTFNQYFFTPRKVFDSYVDRTSLKRARDREDMLNDFRLIMKQIKHLSEDLEELKDHVRSHCSQLIDGEDPVVEHGNEELE